MSELSCNIELAAPLRCNIELNAIGAPGTPGPPGPSVDISGKVDKVTGESLVADTEIAKIHALHADDQDLSGKADLVAGKVPANQLPSYVDDVEEYTNLAAFPVTGESGKIYIALDTNITYRWSLTTYVVIGSSLALGETSSTAYRGDRGKAAYDHSQSTHAPSDAVSLSTVKSDTDVASAISLKHAAHSDDQDLSSLVVKESGKSLVDNTLISEIHALHADDQDLSVLQPKESGKGLSANDLTAGLKSNYDTAYSHSQATHAPSNAVALATVKADTDIADAISKKHSQGTDQYIDHGGTNETTAAQLKSAVTNSHASGSDAETASSIINLGIDEIEFSLINSFLK